MSDFLSDAGIVAGALDRYHEESVAGAASVICQEAMETLVEDMRLAEHATAGDLRGEVLAEFVERYLARTTRLHHPAYMGHQVAVPHYAGSLAAMVDGFTNNAMAIYEMGPPASAIEHFVLNWLISKIGWAPAPYPGQRSADSDHAGGVLTHGGSLANLTALIAARSSVAPEVWEQGNVGDLALVAPAESHYSIERAAGILGIGRSSLHRLEVDERGVVLPDRVPATLRRVVADGKRPIAVVANACSTALGLYDPLDELADVCSQHGVWLHVDGAHGASALLSARHRALMKGVERADSVVWDAHKLLRVPTLCAAVLVRDSRTLDRAFRQEASYLFHDKEQPGFDFIQRTVECTKAGLGLRLFFVLAALGESGLAAYVERQFELAAEAHAWLAQQPGFECAAPPQANIVCFRVQGSDELQLAVRGAVIGRGRFYLTTAEVGGRRWLRLVLMNPDTTMRQVEALADEVRREAGLQRRRLEQRG